MQYQRQRKSELDCIWEQLIRGYTETVNRKKSQQSAAHTHIAAAAAAAAAVSSQQSAARTYSNSSMKNVRIWDYKNDGQWPGRQNEKYRVQQQDQEQNEPTKQKFRLYQDMVAGFGAAFLGTGLGFPLDLIKTRMQTASPTSQTSGATIFNVGRDIVRNEGMGGLFKGLSSPLLTLSVQGCISFSSFGLFKQVYGAGQGWHFKNWLAGLSTGPFVAVLSTVELHVRTQMQLDNIEKQRCRNSFHCMKKIVQNHGTSTLFTGWGVTTLKDSKYFSTYFFVYEGMKNTLQHNMDTSNMIFSKAAVPVAGAVAGVTGWLVSYPLDSVRATLHGQTLRKGETPTALQVSKDIVAKHGVRGFYIGISTALTRVRVNQPSWTVLRRTRNTICSRFCI